MDIISANEHLRLMFCKLKLVFSYVCIVLRYCIENIAWRGYFLAYASPSCGSEL